MIKATSTGSVLKPLQDEYRSIVQSCADQGKALMRSMTNSGMPEPMYLFVRPSTIGKPGELFLARESAPNVMNYQLVTGEGLRGNIPYDNYFTWIFERATRAPVLSM